MPLPRAVPIVMVQPGPLMALRLARPEARQERAEAARPAVPAGSHRGLEMPARHPARPSAAVARKAQVPQSAVPRVAEPVVVWRPVALRLAAPTAQAAVAEALVEPQQEVPPALAAQPRAARAELAVSGAAAPQPAAGSVAAVRLPEEGAAALDEAEAAQPRAAVRDAVVAARRRVAQAAVRDAAGARRRGAQVAAPDAEEAPRREARDAAQGVLLSAAAWAALPSIRCQEGRLAPSARARFAHARARLRTAQP
jgi:hypothetical protein